MDLDIDIGNSRVKWRLSNAGSVLDRGVCMHDDFVSSRSLAQAALLARGAPGGIRVCSVAGQEWLEMYRQWAETNSGLPLEVARVCSEAGGVRCAYSEPGKLGVDRWLAVLAAWQHLGETCVVVDAGTALTIDVVAASGKRSDQIQADHLGGYIVPGLKMMSEALYARTEGVQQELAELGDLQPGRDTGAAVLRGGVTMAVAMIERVRAQTVLKSGLPGQSDIPVPVVLTGGDADILSPFIAQPLHSIPDLVLDGLAVALPVAEGS